MTSRTLRNTVLVLALVASVLALAPAAQACIRPIRPVAWFIPHEICCPFFGGPCYIKGWIKIHGFVSVGAGPGVFCGCGITIGGPIKAVDSAMVTDAVSGERLAGFSFNSNATTTQSLAEFGVPGAGFSADVSREIPDGLEVDLSFGVLLDQDADFQQLGDYLVSQGVVTVGEVDPEGNFGGGHLDFAGIEGFSVMTPSNTSDGSVDPESMGALAPMH